MQYYRNVQEHVKSVENTDSARTNTEKHPVYYNILREENKINIYDFRFSAIYASM